MKTYWNTLTKLFETTEVRNKLLFTLAMFGTYRVLAHIPVPGVNIQQLTQIFQSSEFLSLVNIFSGGTLANFSIAALGISPYITAAIIMQLAAMVFPSLKEMQKEGESGQEKYNQYTRLLSIPMAIAQSISILTLLNSQGLLQTTSPVLVVTIVLTLLAGSVVVMWLGELITEFGLGNGISMILLAAIVSQFPVTFAQIGTSFTGNQLGTLLGYGSVFLLVIALMVFMNEAVRKVNIQYAKRQSGSRTIGGQRTHLPVKVNVAGVMPIIFAFSLLIAPPFLGQLLTSTSNNRLVEFGQQLQAWFNPTSFSYMTITFLLVFAFTFFSALIFFNTEDISDELKKSGAFIPGIRPGGPTKEFLDYVVTRVSFIGAVFLGSIAILPSIFQYFTGMQALAVGGTSLLIVVSVIIQTAKQVESMLIGENYEQFT